MTLLTQEEVAERERERERERGLFQLEMASFFDRFGSLLWICDKKKRKREEEGEEGEEEEEEDEEESAGDFS